MPERFRDCRFFLWWALRLFGVIGFRKIVIVSFDNTVFALYLCDVEVTYLQTRHFQHIRLDFIICRLVLSRGNVEFVQVQVDMYDVIRLFSGQSNNRLNVLGVALIAIKSTFSTPFVVGSISTLVNGNISNICSRLREHIKIHYPSKHFISSDAAL